VAAAAIGMSPTLWFATAVDLTAVAALLAAPSVGHLQRLSESPVEHSARQVAAD